MDKIVLTKEQREGVDEAFDALEGYNRSIRMLSYEGLKMHRIGWNKLRRMFPEIREENIWSYDSTKGIASKVGSDSD